MPTLDEKLTEQSRLEMLHRIGQATNEDIEDLKKLRTEELVDPRIVSGRAVEVQRDANLGGDEVDPEIAEMEKGFPKRRKSWRSAVKKLDAWGLFLGFFLLFSLYQFYVSSKRESLSRQILDELAYSREVNRDLVAQNNGLETRSKNLETKNRELATDSQKLIAKLTHVTTLEEQNHIVAKAMESIYVKKDSAKALQWLEAGWIQIPEKRLPMLRLFWDLLFDVGISDPALVQSTIKSWDERWTRFSSTYRRSRLDAWSAWKLQNLDQSDEAFVYLDRSVNTSQTKFQFEYALKFFEVLESVGKQTYIPKVMAATNVDTGNEVELKVAAAEIYQRAGMLHEGQELIASLSVDEFNRMVPTLSHLRLQRRLLMVSTELAMSDVELKVTRALTANVHQYQQLAAEAFGEQETQLFCGFFDLGNGKWTGAIGHFDKCLAVDGDADPAFLKSLRDVASLGSFQTDAPTVLAVRIQQSAEQAQMIDDLSLQGTTLAMVSAVAALKGSNRLAGEIAMKAIETFPDDQVKHLFLPQLTLYQAMAKWAEEDRDAAIRLARESRELAVGEELQRNLDITLEHFRFKELADGSVLAAARRIFPLVPFGPVYAASRQQEDDRRTPPKPSPSVAG